MKVAGINADNDTNQGMLIPKLAKARVAKISDANLRQGTLIYIEDTAAAATHTNAKVSQITSNGFYYYDGIAWQPLQKPATADGVRADYVVSADGTTLMEWMNKRTETVDMNQYEDMAGVKIIEQNLLQGSRVKKFIMREGVTTVGHYAFADNPNMEITLANSLTHIENNAFQNNTKIKNVNLPNLLTVEAEAFSNTGITSVEMATIKEISARAFVNNSLLATVSLPQATIIGYEAFINNASLTNLDLPKVTEVKASAFRANTSLATLNLPQAITIGDYAFSGNTSLTSISLPNATTIERGVFLSNPSLTSVSLPKLTALGQQAFAGCINLNNIVIPSTIQKLAYGAFLASGWIVGIPFVTMQGAIPPIWYDGYDENLDVEGPVGAIGNKRLSTVFRVPMASVQAYKTAWAGIVDESKIVGY